MNDIVNKYVEKLEGGRWQPVGWYLGTDLIILLYLKYKLTVDNVRIDGRTYILHAPRY